MVASTADRVFQYPRMGKKPIWLLNASTMSSKIVVDNRLDVHTKSYDNLKTGVWINMYKKL